MVITYHTQFVRCDSLFEPIYLFLKRQNAQAECQKLQLTVVVILYIMHIASPHHMRYTIMWKEILAAFTEIK